MAPRCGCGSSSGACNCLIISGDVATLTVTGAGSAVNPYVLTALGGGGGGGGLCATGTRAAILAIRTSGTLTPGCAYLITNGPTIGVAGFTSTTQVMVWALSNTELGLPAQVNSSFDNSGWAALYDIDANAYLALEDNLGNQVRDASGAIIATQFPWGFANVSGNIINASDPVGGPVVLTGWVTPAAAGSSIVANRIDGGGPYPAILAGAPITTVVNLTGLTGAASSFYGNTVQGAQFAFTTPSVDDTQITNNIFRDNYRMALSPSGTGFLVFVVNGNTFRSHAVGSAVADFVYLGNDLLFIVDSNEFLGGALTVALDGAAPAAGISIQGSKIYGPISRDAASTNNLGISNCTIEANICNLHGTGAIAIANSTITGASLINRSAGCVASLTITNSKLNGTQLAQSAAALFQCRIIDSQLNDNQITQQFAGAINIETSVLNGGHIQNTLSATRGLTVLSCLFNEGFIEQGSTVDNDLTGDQIYRTEIMQGLIMIAGAAGAAGFFQPVDQSTIKQGSTLTLTNITGALQFSELCGGSQLFLSNGSANLCRFSCGANVTAGAFTMSQVIVDGQFTKVATANNTNTLTNKAFDDFV